MFSELGSGWMQGAPRREWLVLAKRRNAADDRFPVRPKGAIQMIQYGVTALNKDWAIVYGLCLVLDHLDSSEHDNITLKEYQGDRPSCKVRYALNPNRTNCTFCNGVISAMSLFIRKDLDIHWSAFVQYAG